MPTYEYRCPDGHAFERFYRKISDSAAEIPCPECGKPAVRQLSGGAGLVFKGSGFYLTDYGKNAHRRGGPESSGGTKGGTSAGEKSGGGGASGGGESGSGGSTPGESKSSESKSTGTPATEAKSSSSSTSSKDKKSDK